MNRKEINDEIKKTMQSLDEVKRASPGSYFYSRFQSRLHSDNQIFILSSLWGKSRYLLAAAAMILLIFGNIFLAVEYDQYLEKKIDKDQELIVIAEEYSLTSPVLYNINENN